MSMPPPSSGSVTSRTSYDEGERKKQEDISESAIEEDNWEDCSDYGSSSLLQLDDSLFKKKNYALNSTPRLSWLSILLSRSRSEKILPKRNLESVLPDCTEKTPSSSRENRKSMLTREMSVSIRDGILHERQIGRGGRKDLLEDSTWRLDDDN